MKILHTSDWHLGRSLYTRKRYKEFSAFLDWLAETIESEKIDVLLVAGDIFDTSTPSNKAQELYYGFLCRVAMSCCRHVVIIAGNHDSPSFLNAPKELLRALNVHVVGTLPENPEDEIIEIVGLEDGKPDFEKSAIICAVPYLRDRDIRVVEPGETIDDKNRKLVAGIQNHYAEIVRLAEQKRDKLLQRAVTGNSQSSIPLIALGHLFTSGGKTFDGDGVRELYVGSLAHVGRDIFPAAIDYLALGHLHVPQTVGGTKHLRYSGSPLPMGFGEAQQEKQVVIVEFGNKDIRIREVPVPCFQKLLRIAGDFDKICAQLKELKLTQSSAWLEIEYQDSKIIPDLHEKLHEQVLGSDIEILRIKNLAAKDRAMTASRENETLDDLNEHEVFTRCLEAFEVPEEERDELRATYSEVLRSLYEEDVCE